MGNYNYGDAKGPDDCAEMPDYDSLAKECRDLSSLLAEIELLARINCPINAGSPMHKSILKTLKKYGATLK